MAKLPSPSPTPPEGKMTHYHNCTFKGDPAIVCVPPRPESVSLTEETRLLHMIELRDTVIDRMRVERLLLAKLAADTPQFDNPLIAFKAQELRDKILSESPDVR